MRPIEINLGGIKDVIDKLNSVDVAEEFKADKQEILGELKCNGLA